MAGPERPAGRAIRLLQPIGRGGFGTVFLAEVRGAEGLVQRLAVKLIHERWASDTGIAARARDEARLMSQLNHDNVVRIHGLTRIGGRSAVLMEYVEGVDAGTLAAGGDSDFGLPLRVVAQIGEQVAAALDAAWHTLSPESGEPLRVVHRDIKPANVLVSANGAVKVMDFGIARGDIAREAQTGSAQFGTGRYMAPERWLYGEAGAESDVYSLGVTLWELCTAQPLERLPLDRVSFEDAVEDRLAALASALGVAGAIQLGGVLRDMLAFEPRDRCTAAMVVEALSALADEADGPGLRRFARLEVPGLRDARLHSLATDPDAEGLTGTVYTGVARGSNDTFAGLYLPEETSALPASAIVPPRTSDTVALDPIDAQDVALTAQSARRPAALGAGLLLLVGAGSMTYWVRGEGAPAPDAAVDTPVAAPVRAQVDAAPEPETAPEPEPEPVRAAPVVRPVPKAEPTPVPPLQHIDLPAPRPAAADAVTDHEPHVVVIDERAEVAIAPPAEAEPEVMVTVKILADPRQGTVSVGGRSAQVGDSLTVPIGEHSVRFEGPGWHTTCQVTLTSTTSKLKFERRGARCLPQ